MKKVAVVGSRMYPNLKRVKDFIWSLDPNTIVVSGGATGVDQVAEKEAKKRNLETIIFRADWKKYGKKAGYIRNKLIVDNSTEIVAFWDRRSRGTKITMDLAKQAKKKLSVIYP